MQSFLYEGKLRHHRFAAPSRSFEYSLFMMYLDLGELDVVYARRWFWSTRSPNVAWFRRADHYGDPRVPLDAAIRDLVAETTSVRPEGPVRLLTHLRYLGHCFNPVSFYYCFSKDGQTLETIVAEVSNTPWNERHMYVLSEAENIAKDGTKRYDFKKAFHVSPFLGMDTDYAWRFGTPPSRDGDALWVQMENRQDGAPIFAVSLALRRRPIDGLELARALMLHPAMTIQVIAGIYWQAFRLWWRGARFYPHPRNVIARHP